MKLAAMPPPMEYPISANLVLPVQEMGDDVIARRMQVAKKRADCGVGVGVVE